MDGTSHILGRQGHRPGQEGSSPPARSCDYRLRRRWKNAPSAAAAEPISPVPATATAAGSPVWGRPEPLDPDPPAAPLLPPEPWFPGPPLPPEPPLPLLPPFPDPPLPPLPEPPLPPCSASFRPSIAAASLSYAALISSSVASSLARTSLAEAMASASACTDSGSSRSRRGPRPWQPGPSARP